MSHFINKMLQKWEAAIIFLICSQKQFYELTPSLHLLIPALTSACDEAVSLEILERYNTSSLLFSFSTFNYSTNSHVTADCSSLLQCFVTLQHSENSKFAQSTNEVWKFECDGMP